MMVLGVLIAKNRYTLAKYMFVLMIVAGVGIFIYKDKPTSTAAEASLLGIGEILLLVSLMLDGFRGAIQDRMRKEYQSKSGHVMYFINMWATLFLVIAVLVTGELWQFLSFVGRYPYVIPNILGFTVMGALGQVFIYLTVCEFGSLPCSIITTTRKFFTLLASVVLFGNKLSTRQWFAAALVFTGLTLDSIHGKQSRQKHSSNSEDNSGAKKQ